MNGLLSYNVSFHPSFLEAYFGELSSLPPLLPVDGERVVAEEEDEDE